MMVEDSWLEPPPKGWPIISIPSGEWQPVETAPPDVPLLLYIPTRHFTNEERIEVAEFRNTRAGTQHAWATLWMPLDGLLEQARGKSVTAAQFDLPGETIDGKHPISTATAAATSQRQSSNAAAIASSENQ